jgi:hypothetical protein
MAMPKNDRPDREAGMPKMQIGSRSITAYDPGLALRVCEEIAEGKFLSDVLKMDGLPCRATWYRWCMLYPDLKTMYETARAISAEGFEEDLLARAKEMLHGGIVGLTALRLDEIKTAMTQLRWSAARRDPSKFAERPAVQLAIPIQINTSLDLEGKLGGGGTPNVYSISVTRDVAEAEDAEVEDLPPVPQLEGPRPAPGGGLAIKPARKPRTPKGHKTPSQLRATMAAKAKAKPKPKEQAG